MATNRRGQALIELAIGLLTLALVVITLTDVAVRIVKDLKEQNMERIR